MSSSRLTPDQLPSRAPDIVLPKIKASHSLEHTHWLKCELYIEENIMYAPEEERIQHGVKINGKMNSVESSLTYIVKSKDTPQEWKKVVGNWLDNIIFGQPDEV